MIKNLPLFWKVMLPILAGMVLLLSLGAWLTLDLRRQMAEESGLMAARSLASTVVNMRRFYTEHVVDRAQAAGMHVRPDWEADPQALPLPATLTRELSKLNELPGGEMRLFSRWPFSNRTAAETRLDDFEQQALAHLEAAPGTAFWRVEQREGQPVYRYALADRMSTQACVNCHNAHPQSPRAGWKLGDVRGVFEVAIPLGGMKAGVDAFIARTLALLGVSLLLTVGLIWVVVHRVGRELQQASAAAERIARFELDAAVPAAQSSNETGRLLQALEQLKSAQAEVVQSETLASLGAMVAGIAHEVNTPIGTTVTAASTLNDRFAQIRAQLALGTMSKSNLQEFLQTGQQLSELALNCGTRAAELIASFKQVAVDQASERRREFELRSLVMDVLATLRPQLKNRSCRIEMEVEVPENIQCDGYPGPLGQVLSNLVLNAAIHAFEGREQGRIRITARQETPETLLLQVEDDGIGMSAQTAARAFEPFFTTRAGRGGSGLGLAICQRIVRSLLMGELELSSTPGQGSVFSLRLPRVTPELLQPASDGVR
ncbi:ATP-binding protein [Pelomonas sp. SE-A7]|uniref:ATP-binding protein n=1 Tax=Pelomonas sp. SE-A7 TaxID=3054953 RepID=UPI00259CC109|nr:ATP-binding protein [Pelomonas sp. SE-A7]MDM4766759.1 ATP-binding protein [Pelomonas sp. SE-A7]